MSAKLRPALASTASALAPRVARRTAKRATTKKTADSVAVATPAPVAESSAVVQANAQDSSIVTLRPPEARLRPPRQLVKAAVTPPNRPGRRYPPAPIAQQGTTVALCYATAVKYRFQNLLPLLGRLGLIGAGKPSDALNLLGEVIYLPQWPPQAENAGEAFIFENGAFVTWGVTQENAEALLASLIRPLSRRAEDQVFVEFEGYYAPETDELQYEVLDEPGTSSLKGTDIQLRPAADASATTSTLFTGPVLTKLGLEARPREEHFEAVGETPVLLPHVPEEGKQPLPRNLDDLLVRLSFSSALVRSTKLSIHESDLESKLSKTARIPRFMERGDEEATGSRFDALQLFGTTLHERHQITMGEQNIVDPPEMFWQAREPILEKHYTDLCEALDFHRRLDIQNTKLDYAYDLASVLLQFQLARAQQESNARARRVERYMLAVFISAVISYIYINRDKLPRFKQPGAREHGGTYASLSSLGVDRFPEQGPELPPAQPTPNSNARNV